jgi:hypothetical protein
VEEDAMGERLRAANTTVNSCFLLAFWLILLGLGLFCVAATVIGLVRG